jgi:signal peptidase I
MKDAITAAFVLLLLGSEAALWVDNPMHIPASFVPARLVGFQLFTEQGTTMEPAIPAGRHVLVVAWPYLKGAPRIGDVIAFEYPLDPSIADLKRVVALGGSTVESRDGVLYVDGMRASEPYLSAPLASVPDFAPVHVPPGSVFVLGDNRLESEDSRIYGPIARDRIIGKRWQ